MGKREDHIRSADREPGAGGDGARDSSRRPPSSGTGSPDGESGRFPSIFTTDIKRITFWLSLSGAALAALGAAGLVQAWMARDQPRLAVSVLYSLFILILACAFFLYLRRKRRWYLEVENERLRERAAGEAAGNAEDVCAICHKYSPEDMASCAFCGRRTCGDCLREEDAGDELAPKGFCPVCWEAGEPCRERMLELEIVFDARRERLEKEWREAAERLTGGETGREAGERLKRFDASIGASFREKILELELELEEEREAQRAKWREEAVKLVRLRRTSPGDGEERDRPGQALDD